MSRCKGIPPSLLDVSEFTDQGLRLLVIEDNDADFELLCHHLTQGGMKYRATHIKRLEDLKRQLEHDEWQLVISDHMLPGFSSEEALQRVQNSGLDIPFIIVSGHVDEHSAAEVMRAGADDYVMKNNMTRLIPAIERSIRNANERRNLIETEHAQRETERQLSTLTDNMPGVLLQMRSVETHALPSVPFVSDKAKAILGFAPRYFLENPHGFFELFEPEDTNTLLNQLRCSTMGEPVVWEGRLLEKNTPNPTRWFYLSALPAQQGNACLWDGVLLEISEQKNAQASVLAVEKRREQERANIAREIHDEMGSSLIKLKTDLAYLSSVLSTHPHTVEKLNDMHALLEDLLHASQSIANNLRPSILDAGLVAALAWQVKDFQNRTHIAVSFRCNVGAIEVDAEEKTALFRILQEALTNIVKHAQATQVEVELFVAQKEITLEIQDNGKGISNADKHKHTAFGLRGMQERMAALNGWGEVSGSAGTGTTVMVAIPRTKYSGLEAKHD